jgi:hypothetical protein
LGAEGSGLGLPEKGKARLFLDLNAAGMIASPAEELHMQRQCSDQR